MTHTTVCVIRFHILSTLPYLHSLTQIKMHAGCLQSTGNLQKRLISCDDEMRKQSVDFGLLRCLLIEDVNKKCRAET